VDGSASPHANSIASTSRVTAAPTIARALAPDVIAPPSIVFRDVREAPTAAAVAVAAMAEVSSR
jgi:hypothetical protein